MRRGLARSAGGDPRLRPRNDGAGPPAAATNASMARATFRIDSDAGCHGWHRVSNIWHPRSISCAPHSRMIRWDAEDSHTWVQGVRSNHQEDPMSIRFPSPRVLQGRCNSARRTTRMFSKNSVSATPHLAFASEAISIGSRSRSTKCTEVDESSDPASLDFRPQCAGRVVERDVRVP